MKKLHLICNAHIDPIWQWEWEEGASTALSTYQSAANLLKDFDYVFCHNEANLYQYVERFAPELFKETQRLSKEGKWKVMGGWFLQPDCLMPCGEGIVRQIQEGKIYFTSKYDYYPKTVINFDPFGHSRGLVQIVKKCGQENYMFMRPYSDWGKNKQLDLPAEIFTWVGYDGSTIKAARTTSYSSPVGDSLTKIKNDIKFRENEEISFSTWGVGNHGGGPSRKDLEDIDKFIKESDIEIVHSDPDTFFSEVNPSAAYDKSIISCMVGCYTSMIELKQKYRELERQLMFTEKICSIASLKGIMEYPVDALKQVTEDMLNVQFHDILPGDMIKAGEENGFTYINHGLHILNQSRADAFYALFRGQEVAKPNTYPVMVFNPKTYECEQYVTVDLSVVVALGEEQDLQHEYVLDVFDSEGNKLPAQNVKEVSNLGYDFRKRVVFKANLKPLSINRFTLMKRAVAKKIYPLNKDVVFENESKYVKISAKTGLIESYKVNGIELAKSALFKPYMYQDYEDPWGMNYKHVGWEPTEFALSKKPCGPFIRMNSFQVIEDGDIYLECEAFFEHQNSKIRIGYKIYKQGDMVDVNVSVFPGDTPKAFKLHVPVIGDHFLGEQIFGREELFDDGRECIAHDYVATKIGEDKYIEIITPSTYGCSYKDGEVILTLMRTPTYCAHPVPGFPLLRENIYIPSVDMGMREFSYRIQLAKGDELKRNADLFVEKPYALNIFPTVDVNKDNGFEIHTDNELINVVTIKKARQTEGYIVRLENNSEHSQECEVFFDEKHLKLSFGKFEVKTVVYNGELTECKEMLI